MGEAYLCRGGGGVKIKLLWENASPQSTFPAQTISLKLDSTDLVIINCIRYPGDKNILSTAISKVGDTVYLNGSFQYFGYRNAQITTTGIIFGDGYYVEAYSLGSAKLTSVSSVCLPYRICVIKGVR